MDVLTLDSAWAIGEHKYRAIKEALPPVVRAVVEFGSGRSTVRLAQDYPDAIIYSVENDPLFRDRTAVWLRERALDNAKLVVAKLRWQRINSCLCRTYDASAVRLPQGTLVDLILVDGPVEAITSLGRECALHLVFDQLAVGGVVVLDDYHRASARTAVRNWLATYPELAIQESSVPGELAILRKGDGAGASQDPGPGAIVGSYAAAAAAAIRLTRHWIGSRRQVFVNGRLGRDG